MNNGRTMELLRVIVLSFFILVGLFTISKGCPRGRHHHNSHATKKEEAAKSRSYIDIDASDPFKVPKSSHYINKPMPEFDKVDTKEEEESENRKNHGRGDMEKGHGDNGPMVDNGEEEAKNMGRSSDREGESERERGESNVRENEGENYAEKVGEVPDEHGARIMQTPMEDQGPGQEEATNKELDMTENAKSLEKIEQDVEGKSDGQNIDTEAMGTEEGFKKGNPDRPDPNAEEENAPIVKNSVNQM